MSEWKDISTYPRDGSEVLVSMTHSLGHGEWETLYWVDWCLDEYEWPIYRERIDIPFPPTHWMEIPKRIPL